MRKNRKERQSDKGHGSHPVRNFGYLLYTLLNAAAFVGLFYGIGTANAPLAALCAALVLLAFLVGIVRPMRHRKR